jgi:hypothetical protein
VSSRPAISVPRHGSGAVVACADINDGAAAVTLSRVERGGGVGEVLVGDVADPDTRERLARRPSSGSAASRDHAPRNTSSIT